MLQLIREYIKYRRKAKRRHGIHSPFVYEFGDQCLSIPVPKSIQKLVTSVDKSEQISRGYFRRFVTMKRAKLVYRILLHYQPHKILVDESFRKLVNYLKKNEVLPVSCEIVERKKNGFPQLLESRKAKALSFDVISIDFLAFDEIDSEMQDSPLIHDETIIILTGIRATTARIEKWEKFVQRPAFHLTMDLFETGIVMKRSHQQKEHFLIR